MIVEACGGDVGCHVLDLVEGLADGGCEVHLISSPERGDRSFLGRLEAASRVRRRDCAIGRSSPLSGLMAVRMTRCYIRAHGPLDIIHGHDTKGGCLARIAVAGARLRVLHPTCLRHDGPAPGPAGTAPAAFDVVEVLFHLAAAVRGGEDVQFAATVVGTERLLEAMARSGTHRLLLASSFQVDLPRQGKAAGPARPLPVRGPVQAAAV